MTVLEVVNKLNAKGHQVVYRVRSDGGILITKIDGISYSGAKGNAVARQMVGSTLSAARERQLKKLNPKKKHTDFSEETERLLRKVQRAEAKRRKTSPDFTEMTSRKNVRWTLEHEGYEAAIEKLNQNLKHAQGLAYDKVVDALTGYIRELQIHFNGEAYQEFEELIRDIELNRDNIKESAIYDVYTALYEINHGVQYKDVINNVRRILGL